MDKLLSLLNQPRLIESSYDFTFKASLFSAIKNGTIQAFIKSLAEENISVKVLATNPEALTVNTIDEYDITDPNIPENSLAIITVEGQIYPWKTFRIEQCVNKVNTNPNIIGILFFVNTPGGYVHRVDIASEAIKNSIKPIVTYYTGLGCSAGTWMFSGSKRIFTASKLDTLGSVGTMTTFTDSRKFWEENGFIDTDLYATKSTRKNENSREAEKGNFAPIIEDLDYCNNLFHQTIQQNLGIKPDSEVFTGATFNGEQAVKLGLVHEIGSLEKAMNYLMYEGLKLQANNLK